jgi:hypothetical protein
MKKWASRIICRFIQRFGNPRYSGDEYKQFAEYFRANSSIVLLTPVMNVIANKSRGGFVTDEVYRNCLSYINSAVEMSPTYKLIKPHLDFILFGVIFPTLSLNYDDIRYSINLICVYII